MFESSAYNYSMLPPNIVQTKITPPKITGKVLARSRVNRALQEVMAHRLTLIQAGAGYGKSTAMAMLAADLPYVVWYHLSEEDQDPVVFLRHLCYASKQTFPALEGLPITLLDSWDSTRGPLIASEVVAQYVNAVGAGVDDPVMVVLDDLHLVAGNPDIAMILDSLIGLAPGNIHYVGATRTSVQLPNLFRWRSQGKVLEMDQSILVFDEGEIAELFRVHYDYDLSFEEVEDLFAATEGWVISLQLIGRSMAGGTANSVQDALSRRDSPLDSLFEILTRDVLEGQSDEMQDFMRKTSVLRTLDQEACNWLIGAKDSMKFLDTLVQNDLFVSGLGDRDLRYHPIFQQFLYRQLSEDQRKKLHQKAAEFFQQQDHPNQAIYHYLRAADYLRAAALLDSYSGELQAMGHLDTLAYYLDSLSPEALSQFPNLIHYMGELARYHSRFQDALGWYQQAELLWRERNSVVGVSKALRGQARIYLDTVNPTKAEELLQQALRLSDGTTDRETRVKLYQLLAENKLNLGHVEEAETLREQADLLQHEGPSNAELWVRVLLRTGKLDDALRQLEIQAQEEASEPISLPRAHRETQLLLSLIYAMQGKQEMALQTAEAGILRGQELESPFVTAVGYMRKGNAVMMRSDRQSYQQAEELYQQAIQISRELSTPRLRVEAFWGLTRVNGFQGNLDDALKVAKIGMDIADQAGDEWIASLIRLALGASYLLVGNLITALDWLDQAVRGFHECSDSFGLTAARMWQCIAWYSQDAYDLLLPTLTELFTACQKNQYDFLLYRQTMVGLPDERLIVPLLLWARKNKIATGYVDRLLVGMGLDGIELHPGYQIQVRTLGGFEVWRGKKTIAHSDWKREKTRQLFQLLLVNRKSPLDREQICEFLWPGGESKVSQQNFKVALNGLYGVLEPNRIAGEDSAFVLREGPVYGLRPKCDISLDVDQFEKGVSRAESLIEVDLDEAIREYKSALSLYEGEFLPSARFAEWSAEEREYLAVLYLQSADRFCELSLNKHRFGDVINVCQHILAQDNCWERAYRHLMVAYAGMGDHGQMARTYKRCVESLDQELGVTPSPETKALFKQLTNLS